MLTNKSHNRLDILCKIDKFLYVDLTRAIIIGSQVILYILINGQKSISFRF